MRKLALIAFVLFSASFVTAEEFYVCSDTERINLESCAITDQFPDNPPKEKFFLKSVDGCLTAKNEGSICSLISVRDDFTEGVVNGLEATVSLKIQGHSRVLLGYPVDSSNVRVPAEAKIRLEAPGYETKKLTITSEDQLVRLRHGQQLMVKTEVPDGNIQELRLSLRSGNGSFSWKAGIDEPIPVERFPLGIYDLECRAEGYPAVTTRVELRDRWTPMPVTCAMTKGSCIEIPFDLSGFEVPPATIGFRLWAIQPIGAPRLQDSGRLEVFPGELPKGLICDVPAGRYELEIGDQDIIPQFLDIETVKTKVHLDKVVLQPGESFSVEVVNENFEPIPGAAVTFEEGRGESRRLITKVTKNTGKIMSPASQSPLPMRVAVHSEGYLSTIRTVETNKVIFQLERPGRIAGRVEAKACRRVQLEISRECKYAETCWEPIVQDLLRECDFAREVYEPGRYRVVVSSQEEEPFSEIVEIVDREGHDFGVITLETGVETTIEIVSRGGFAVSDAYVELEGLGRGLVSDSDGLVVFSCIPDNLESIQVRVSHSDFAAFVGEISISLNRVASVELKLPGRIFGWVLDQSGKSLTGQYVSAIGPGPSSKSALIGADGFYEIQNLQAGRWQVQTSSNVYERGVVRLGAADIQTAELVEGQEVEVSFMPEFVTYGLVTIEGYASAGQRLMAVDASGAISISFSTDEKGGYSISLPRAGMWRFIMAGALGSAEIQPPCPCRIDVDLRRYVNGGL